jgi:hypothetical protein
MRLKYFKYLHIYIYIYCNMVTVVVEKRSNDRWTPESYHSAEGMGHVSFLCELKAG